MTRGTVKTIVVLLFVVLGVARGFTQTKEEEEKAKKEEEKIRLENELKATENGKDELKDIDLKENDIVSSDSDEPKTQT